MDIHEEEESDKDTREVLEENTEFDKVESLGHVHQTAINVRVIPHKIADCFNES